MSETLVRSSAAPPKSSGGTAAPRARREVWRPSPRGTVARVAVLLLLGAAVLAIPALVPATDLNIVSRVVVFAMVALSLNLLVGYTGQVSLGHSAFLGVGAFSSAFALTRLGYGEAIAADSFAWLMAVLFAIAIGAGAALLLGGIALRIKGLYLALVTLAYGLFAERVLFNIPALTGGGAGATAPRPVFAETDLSFAYLCIGALALVWVIDWRLTSSKAGRAIQALRDSEKVAASWGINVTGYKLLAFVISGMVAGLAGALFASIEQIVSNLTFTFLLSLSFLVMVVVGGIGSRIGVVIIAAVFSSMSFVLDRLAEDHAAFPVDGTAAGVLQALLLILVLVRFPGGIAQLLAPVIRWCSFKPFRGGKATSGPAAAGGSTDARP